MNKDAVQLFLTQTQDCAKLMLEHSAHIKQELPKVDIPKDQVSKAKKISANLTSTSQDVTRAVADIEKLLAKSPEGSKEVGKRIKNIVAKMKIPIGEMYKLVQELQEASRVDKKHLSAFVLFIESAAKILRSFNLVLDTAGKVEEKVESKA